MGKVSKDNLGIENAPYTVLCHSSAPEWLEMRKTGIGGSDSPILCGQSTYGSWMSLAAVKTGQLDDFKDTEITLSGKKMEPFIAEWTLEEVHRKGMTYGFLIRSNDVEWLICTPDWIVFEDDEELGQFAVPLQVKNTHWKADEWEDGVPSDVMVQVQHEMLCFGAPWAYVAVLLTGNRLRWKKVMPDHHIQEQILDQGADFWSRLRDNAEMPVDDSDHTKKALFAMHPDDNGQTIALNAELMEVSRGLTELKDEAKETAKQIALCSNRLRAALGDNTFGTFPDGSGVTYKTQSAHTPAKKAYDSKSRVLRQQKAK